MAAPFSNVENFDASAAEKSTRNAMNRKVSTAERGIATCVFDRLTRVASGGEVEARLLKAASRGGANSPYYWADHFNFVE